MPDRASQTDGTGLLLETLRLGVVPDDGASAYTVGRDALLAVIDRDLDDADGGTGATRCVLGGYGTGKTHLLELIAERARARNFLVARAVLDPLETAPSHPRRVYAALMQSLSYPETGDAARGLGPLLQKAANSPEALTLFDVQHGRLTSFEPERGQHLYLTTALRWFRALGDSHENEAARSVLLQWIEGLPSALTEDVNATLRAAARNQGHLYSLQDFRPWARIYGYLLSGIAAMARATGYAGLVVLLDEAEFYSLLSTEDQRYAQTLFQAMSYAAVGSTSDLPFLREDLEIGGSGVLKRLPPRYAEQSHLYVSFAMTPHEAGVEALRQAVPADCIVELPHLEPSDYDELVRRVLTVFEGAEPDAELPGGLNGPLAQVVRGLLSTGVVENPRQAIKFLVQFLDTAHRQPRELPQVFRTLRDQLPLG